MKSDFWEEESGAVTVDWTVMTASIVGLGIATYGVVSGGIQNLSGDIDRNLERPFVQTSFLTPDDFSNGPGSWVGVGTSFQPGFGDVLGPVQGNPDGRETFYQDFEIPGGALEVQFNFDLLSFDSIDGGPVDNGWGANEGPVMYLDGQEIARAASVYGNLTWTYSDAPGIEIESTVVQSDTHIGGPNRWFPDGINQVNIKFDEPAENVRLGFGLAANQSLYDESMGIDNFTFQAM